MYKIYGILGAEYPYPDYHQASGAKPLVWGQGAKPHEAKSNFIFWTSCGSGNIMAWGGWHVPLCPPPLVDPPMYDCMLLMFCLCFDFSVNAGRSEQGGGGI